MVRKTRKKQRKSNKIKRHMNKTKRKYNKRKNVSKTKKKNQSGGFLDVLGIGLGAIAGIASLAFAGYKYTNVVEDKNIVELLLNNTANIEYLPKYSIIAHSVKNKEKTGDTYIDRYLKCISNTEFIDFIRENPDLLKTSTIKSILKNISDIDSSLNSLNKLLSNYEDINDEFDQKLTINTLKLVDTDDKLLNDLKVYLLATAEYSKNSRNYELDVQNKLAKSDVNWIDIIFDGGSDFDPIFDGEVDKLLEDRGSLSFVTSNITELLKSLKDNYELVESINHKMRDCTTTPEGYLNYITKDITWNDKDKCLECPKEDCLIYIYQYYYTFLNKESDIRVLDKIYILMLCEARICLLSKCIVLEALRQEKGDKTFVKSILDKIYERDQKRNTTSANIPEEYSSFTMIKKPTKKTLNKRNTQILSGGGDEILPTDGDTGKKLDEKPPETPIENNQSSDNVLDSSNDIITSSDDNFMDNLLSEEKKPEDIPETTDQTTQENIDEVPKEENKLDSNPVEEDKSSKESIDLLDTSNEEIIDKEYLLIRKLLDIDLSNYLMIQSKNIQMIVDQYNSMVNNKQDKKDLELRKIIIKESTPENIESNIEELFPLLEYVLKSYNKYMNINSLCRPEFENYYDLYCRYNKIFTFISPRLIGIRFFQLKKDINENYWNYDMEEMINKANSILLDGLIDNELTDIIYKFITISLLSSKKPGEGIEGDIEIIDQKKLDDKIPAITPSLESSNIGLESSGKTNNESQLSQLPLPQETPTQGVMTEKPIDVKTPESIPQVNISPIVSEENISALKKIESIKDNSLENISKPTPTPISDKIETKSESTIDMSTFTPMNVDSDKKSEESKTEKTTEDTPKEGTPTEDTPKEGSPMERNPMEGNPMEGTPMESNPMEGNPIGDNNPMNKNTDVSGIKDDSDDYLSQMTELNKKTEENSTELSPTGLSPINTTESATESSESNSDIKTDNPSENSSESTEGKSTDSPNPPENPTEPPPAVKEDTKTEEEKPSTETSKETSSEDNPPTSDNPDDKTSQGGGAEEESKEESKEEIKISDKDKQLLTDISEKDKDKNDNSSDIKIIENTNINIENLDYIILSKNEQMLSSVVDNISEIYSISKEEEIVKFIKYIVDINDNKYNNFVNYLRKNTIFMNSLESENPLYKELYDKNIFEDIDKVKAGQPPELQDNSLESNYFNNNECFGMKAKLSKIIKDGGALTELDLRRLEDCDKKNTKTLKKKFTKKIETESDKDTTIE